MIRAQLAVGGPVVRSTAVIASWARYAEGTDEAGEKLIDIDDDRAARATGRGHPATRA